MRTTIENKFKPDDQISAIIIVNESSNLFQLSKKDLQFCREWNFSKFIFIQNGIDIESYDGTHESIVSFIHEFLTIDKIRTVFKFEKSNFSVNQIDSTKSKILESHSVNEELVDTLIVKHKPTIIYGLNPLVKKFTDPILT